MSDTTKTFTPQRPVFKIRAGERSLSIFRRMISTMERTGTPPYFIQQVRDSTKPEEMDSVMEILKLYFDVEQA